MNWRFKLSRRLSMLKNSVLVAVALTACAADRGAPTSPLPDSLSSFSRHHGSIVASATVTPDTLTLAPGTTAQLTAVFKDAYGNVLTNVTMSWLSSSGAVATVSAAGLVTAIAAGSAVISVSGGGRQASATVTVASSAPATPDTTTTPVTPPPITPPPTGATPWLVEDFSTYTSTANLKSNPRGIYTDNFLGDGNESANTSQVFLDQANGAAGLHQSMRYDFPIVNQSDYTIGVNLRLPAPAQEIWVELDHKFSSTFTTMGPASGNADYKFFAARVNGSGRFMLFCGTYGNGWQFGYPGNDQGAHADVAGYYGNAAFPLSTYGTPWDGNWHAYRFHFKVGKPGAAEWWFDGHRMPGFPPGMGIDASSGTSIYGLALGRNMNKGTSRAMSEWWGRIRVYNTSPGW